MGDPETTVDVRTLLDQHRAELLALVKGFRIPQHEAEDLLQEVLLRFVQKQRTIANPRAWLRHVLRRECLMHLRTKRRRVWEAVDGGVLEALAKPLRPEQEVTAFRRDLDGALARVTERCRQVLRRRYILGMKDAEIAEDLGYRASGISKLVLRCMAALLREITRDPDGRPRSSDDGGSPR